MFEMLQSLAAVGALFDGANLLFCVSRHRCDEPDQQAPADDALWLPDRSHIWRATIRNLHRSFSDNVEVAKSIGLDVEVYIKRIVMDMAF